MPPIAVDDVADLFLCWAYADGDLITNLKLQKLLYYAQAWHLVHFDKPLFKESIEAWNYGPVVRSIYRKYKSYGNQPIPSDIKLEELEEAREKLEGMYTRGQLLFLKNFYNQFNTFTAHQLANMTHQEDPWVKAFQRAPSSEIEPDEMRKYYKKVLAETK